MKRMIVLLSVIFVLSSAGFAAALQAQGIRSRDTVSWQESYDESAISELVINMRDADVSILCDESITTLEFEYQGVEGIRDEPVYEQEFGKLTITERSALYLHIVRLSTPKSLLTVRLPKKDFWGITVSSDSGEIRVRNVSCDRLDLSTRTGAITAGQLTGELTLTTVSGRVELDLDAITAPVTVRGGIGAVEAALPAAGDYIIRVSSEHGRVDADAFNGLTYGENAHLVQISTTWGAIEVRERE